MAGDLVHAETDSREPRVGGMLSALPQDLAVVAPEDEVRPSH